MNLNLNEFLVEICGSSSLEGFHLQGSCLMIGTNEKGNTTLDNKARLFSNKYNK